MNRPVEWPKEPALHPLADQAEWDEAHRDYERAMKEAALQRLAIAVDKLHAIETLQITNQVVGTGKTWTASPSQLSDWKSELAKEALAEIGPLPELPQRGD